MIFAGVNVPLTSLPGWAAAVAQWQRYQRDRRSTRLEAGLGVMYTILGLVTLFLLEAESKRKSTLDVN